MFATTVPQVSQRYAMATCLATTNKGIPSVSTEHNQEFLNLNCQVPLAQTGRTIDCCHFVTDFIETSRSQTVHPHERYASPEKISALFDANATSRYLNLIGSGSAYHLLPCQKFGQWLARWSKEINPGAKKLFLVESGQHSMAFELCVRQKAGEENAPYLIRFFNPGLTNGIVECEIQSLNDLELGDQYSLACFIGKEAYSQYFDASHPTLCEQECLVIDCTTPSQQKVTTFSTFESESGLPITGIMMHHAFRLGIKLSKEQIEAFKKLGPEEQKAILFAKQSCSGRPGLFMAMQNGQASMVGQLKELLLALSPDVLKTLNLQELLLAKNEHGYSGLSMALGWGHAEVLREFKELLIALPPEVLKTLDLQELLLAKTGLVSRQLKELLNALPPEELKALDLQKLLLTKTGFEVPGVYLALIFGHIDVLREFKALLHAIPPEILGKWNLKELRLPMPDGFPTLYEALKKDGSILRELKELLLAFPREVLKTLNLQGLLWTEESKAIPGLKWTNKNAPKDIQKNFLELVQALPTEVLKTLNLQEILLVKESKDSQSALFSAFRKGLFSVLDKFKELLRLLPVNVLKILDVPELLLEKTGMRSTGLSLGIQEKQHAGFLLKFKEFLQVLPLEILNKLNLQELLFEEDVSGQCLSYALLNNENLIRELQELLLALPSETLKKMDLQKLLLAKGYARGYGYVPALYFAIENGQAKVIRAYETLLVRLQDEKNVTFDFTELLPKDHFDAAMAAALKNQSLDQTNAQKYAEAIEASRQLQSRFLPRNLEYLDNNFAELLRLSSYSNHPTESP